MIYLNHSPSFTSDLYNLFYNYINDFYVYIYFLKIFFLSVIVVSFFVCVCVCYSQLSKLVFHKTVEYVILFRAFFSL